MRLLKTLPRKFLLIIAILILSFSAPLLFEKKNLNYSCLLADVQVALAAPHLACRTECTSHQSKPCSGYSSCWDKNISCSEGGVDQDGRPCNGCCFSCKVVCDPPPTSPPTISGTLTCSIWGADNWCIGTESLDLNAIEHQGKSVLISGDIKGIAFTCTPATAGSAFCAIPLPEGTGSANYTATSEHGTGNGSKNWQLDSFAPSISVIVDKTPNAALWFSSALNLTASASDATSGIASFEYSLDNIIWLNYTTPLNFSDGISTVYFRASDNAGNTQNANQEIKVDSQDPQLTQNITGTLGANGWYISTVDIENAQSDPAPSAGIQNFEISFDGSIWDA